MDLTFPQIILAAETVAYHRLGIIDTLLSPIVQGLGAKYKSGSVKEPGKKALTQAAKEAHSTAKLMQLGFEIRDVGGE